MKSKFLNITKFSLVLFLSFAFLFLGVSNCFVNNAQALNLYTSAKGCAVIETSTHRKLFAVNENQKLPMASTTKIMTAITAIEYCKD